MNVEPAWRADWEVRLNWFVRFPGMTAVIALIAPVPGSTDTIAAAGSSWRFSVSLIALFASAWKRGSIVV